MTPGVERCYRHIGRVMRISRRAKGWNQETVAMLLGLTRASWAMTKSALPFAAPRKALAP